MKSILIDPASDNELESMKVRLSRSKKQIVEQLIHYANTLKIDPAFLKEGDPSHEIRRTRQELIGFIKTQEKDHLTPLYDQIRLLVSEHQQTSESLLRKGDYGTLEKKMVKNQELIYNQAKTLSDKIEKQLNEDAENKKKHHLEQQARYDALTKDLALMRAARGEEVRKKAQQIVLEFIKKMEGQQGLTGYGLKTDQLHFLRGQIEAL